MPFVPAGDHQDYSMTNRRIEIEGKINMASEASTDDGASGCTIFNKTEFKRHTCILKHLHLYMYEVFLRL